MNAHRSIRITKIMAMVCWFAFVFNLVLYFLDGHRWYSLASGCIAGAVGIVVWLWMGSLERGLD